MRNMMSVGINLRTYLQSGLLRVQSVRPSLSGLEMHLMMILKLMEEFKPQTVVIDPISSLLSIGSISEVRDILIRVIDMLKTKKINAFFTSLTQAGSSVDDSTVLAVSSLADIWIELTNDCTQQQLGRNMRVIKARGMSHEMQPQPFSTTSKGIIDPRPLKK